jgi:glycosyltransferase involved in cell wall biosynthesis
MTDLVVLSLERWDEVWRRNQHLVVGLLRRDPGLRVLFVEPAVDPVHDLSRGRRPHWPRGLRAGPALTGIGPGRLWLHEAAKWLPRRLDHRVDERLAAHRVRAARRVGFGTPLLWVNDPDGAAVLEATDWPALYDVTDDWLLADRAAAETERHARAEARLLERAHEVVVCSAALAQTKGTRREVTLIPNAVDVADYQRPQARPEDLPPGPCALYVGTVHRDRMDVELCESTAEALGQRGHLVIVGPVALASEDVHRLEKAGVVLLGPRPAPVVPAYLQHADVLVVPHVVTPFTESLDPIKLYEYRAVARPVVSTPVAGFRDAKDPRITVVDHSAFAAAVAARVPMGAGGGSSASWDAPRAVPTGGEIPSWSDRVEQMAEVIERLAGAGSRTEGGPHPRPST